MKRKFIAGIIACLSLGLGGCWTSTTALMPEEAKDAIPIRGTFRAKSPDNPNQYYTIRKTGDRVYTMTEHRPGQSDSPGLESFDLLEALPPEKERIGGGYYLVQHDFNDPGSNRFAYTVAMIEIRSEGDVTFDMFMATCPPSVPHVEQGKGSVCPLKTYAEALKMGRDTVAWIKEARAAVFNLDFRTTEVPPEAKDGVN